MRDVKEIMTICAMMDAANEKCLPTCMDIGAQRITAVQQAKAKGSSWEKASRLELVVGPGELATPSGFQKLTT